MKIGSTLAALSALALSSATLAAPKRSGQPKRPNVLIFMLDDTGFGQLGAYGGAISTPNIDRIAQHGIRFNNFHTTALCSPTRAALLTGRNHHSVGTGVITEMETEEPGYTGRIPADKTTWIKAMLASGYQTAAFGKWHNTPLEQVVRRGEKDLWPTGLGFQRFYGFLGADMSQWEPTVWDNETPIEPQVGRRDYHFGADMTDQAIAWLDGVAKGSANEPFLMYYATGAMHTPHHAPQKYIAKYRGRFDDGWDALRNQVFARQKLLGIIPQNADLPPRPNSISAWDDLSADEKRLFARQQEVFAGFLEYTDAQFGRLLDALERKGILDDTIVVIASDNGASGEGGPLGNGEYEQANQVKVSVADMLPHIDELGSKKVYNHYSAGWALAGNTPFRYWKQITHEGGVNDPLIVSWPNGISGRGQVRSQFTHVIDVGPTIMELTGVSAPAVIDGVEQKPMEGVSFVPALRDALAPSAKAVQYFEMLGNRGIWADGWKAVTFHGRLPWDITAASNPNFAGDVWELYKMDDDPTESHDVSAMYPEKLAEMKALFQEEAKKYNVFPLNDTMGERVKETQQRLTGGIREFIYHVGDTRTIEGMSPPVKNRPHTIAATVQIPKSGAEGVLVTSGGRFGGYALMVKNGRLHYIYNYVGHGLYDIASDRPVPSGDVVLKSKFVKTGEYQGRIELYFDDQKVGEGMLSHTVPVIFSVAETFDVSQDTGSPISDAYEVPSTFTGDLRQLVVTMDDL